MFSPLNDPQVEQWLQRLNAPLKRLPAEERAALHLEVRQHLDALAAANEELGSAPQDAAELALKQFGDPGKFGKRMAQEWSQEKMGFRADAAAIGFGFGSYALMDLIIWPLFRLWASHLVNTYGKGTLTFISVIGTVMFYAGFLLVNIAVGRKYPTQAIKGTFYGYVAWSLCWWISLAAIVSTEPELFHRVSSTLTYSLLWIPLWAAANMTISYLASVTKRGWYKPTWEDFKLTLPRRRRIVG